MKKMKREKILELRIRSARTQQARDAAISAARSLVKLLSIISWSGTVGIVKNTFALIASILNSNSTMKKANLEFIVPAVVSPRECPLI